MTSDASASAATMAQTFFRQMSALELLDRLYPRLLAQVDQDADSASYGCCDRQFWHYRLHDFPTGVAQQSGLAFAALYRLAETCDLSACRNLRNDLAPYWKRMADTVGCYTAGLLRQRGMLDEYYPGEASYVATAFGAHAVVKAALLTGDHDLLALPGLRRAADILLSRRPTPAANQDMGASAFLSLYAKATGYAAEAASQAVSRFLSGRSEVCEFAEYGGLDVGYLSVTLNYLGYMAEDAPIPGVHDALLRTARRLSPFITPAGRMGGEFASRSTSYFLPYGFLAAARLEPALSASFARLDLAQDYDKLDDRYLLHYCLPSLAMTALSLAEKGAPAVSRHDVKTSPAPFEDGGIVNAPLQDGSLFIGVAKGGTLQCEDLQSVHIDCGYRLARDGEIYATAVHDPAPSWSMREAEGRWIVEVLSPFQRYRKIAASPAKTIVLRLLSFLGPRLNAFFKKQLITSSLRLAGVELRRVVDIDPKQGRVRVKDSVSGMKPGDRLTLAPPVSLRLVPSARFFQPGLESAFLRAGALDSAEREFDLTAGNELP
jgi:hypothetical protein